MDERTTHAAEAAAAAEAAQDALDAAPASVPPTPPVPTPGYWPGRIEDIREFLDLAEARQKFADLGGWDDLEIEEVYGSWCVYYMVSAIDVLSRRVLLCWDGNLRTVDGKLAQAQTPGEHRELPWCQYPGCENRRRELETCANNDGRLACAWHRTYRDGVFVCKMCDEEQAEASARASTEASAAAEAGDIKTRGHRRTTTSGSAPGARRSSTVMRNATKKASAGSDLLAADLGGRLKMMPPPVYCLNHAWVRADEKTIGDPYTARDDAAAECPKCAAIRKSAAQARRELLETDVVLLQRPIANMLGPYPYVLETACQVFLDKGLEPGMWVIADLPSAEYLHTFVARPKSQQRLSKRWIAADKIVTRVEDWRAHRDALQEQDDYRRAQPEEWKRQQEAEAAKVAAEAAKRAEAAAAAAFREHEEPADYGGWLCPEHHRALERISLRRHVRYHACPVSGCAQFESDPPYVPFHQRPPAPVQKKPDRPKERRATAPPLWRVLTMRSKAEANAGRAVPNTYPATRPLFPDRARLAAARAALLAQEEARTTLCGCWVAKARDPFDPRLLSHWRTYHPASLALVEDAQAKRWEPPMLRCPQCDFETRSDYMLGVHVNAKHPDFLNRRDWLIPVLFVLALMALTLFEQAIGLDKLGRWLGMGPYH